MKTLKQILFTDIKNLAKNMFALIIAVGVCFLPALYAWFNIYSNWDPYGNTGSLQLAAVCLDEGYTDEDGNYENVGQEIMKDMAASDKVDWQFVDTKEEAINGVKSGKYYASVVIEEDFTYNMYNMFVSSTERPTLLFYQNQKKNPVATKISDTVVSTLQSNIDEEFIKVMTTTIFADANDLQATIEEDGGVDAFIGKIEGLNNELISYEQMIDSIIEGNKTLSISIDLASDDAKSLESKTENASNDLSDAADSVGESQNTINEYRDQVDQTVDVMVTMLTNIENQLKEAKLSGDVNAMAEACKASMDDTEHLINNLEALENSLEAAGGFDANPLTKEYLDNIEKRAKEIEKLLSAVDLEKSLDKSSNDIKKAEEEMIKQLDVTIAQIEETRNLINNNLMPQLNTCIDNLEAIVNNASDLMHNMSGVLHSMGDVFGSLQTTISSSDTSLEKTRDALEKISERITKALDKAKAVSEDERLAVLVNTLAGDPDLYGEFFSEPVEIQSVAVYPIQNYGSAVAPFYTTLSIWVGVIILAAIIKVKISRKKYPDATDTQLFFGRGLFFLLMGQIQTAITVLGDLYLLKIQCIHPFLFWLTAALTSLTFTLLIYALVYAFGDVGKAIAVVVLVLQIAGSSGTYPIELLPEFFRKVYIFFPFPYAINAMRECICGLYKIDFVIYLLQLLLFLIPAIAIGLWIRIPFEEINHYMEKRMEDTEMM